MAGAIYGLTDPKTGDVRWVGKTSRYPRSRLAAHLKHAEEGSELPLHAWLRSLRVEPGIITLQRDPRDRDEAERRWIRKLRQQGATLLNVLDGGTGWTKGRPQSPESNRRRSETLKRRGPSDAQLAGLAKAREAARSPDARARAGRTIAAIRTGKRYAVNPHGTRQRYRQGCVCADCRAANAAYQRERYAARRGSN